MSMKAARLAFALALALAVPFPAHAQIQYPNPIKHVIVIVQENRTPDNLFGSNSSANQYFLSGADLSATGLAYSGSGKIKKVVKVPLISIPLASVYNLGDNNPADDYNPDHSHPSWLDMCDHDASGACLMDGANHIPVYCDGNLPPGSNCPPHYPQYAYVQYVDVAPYFRSPHNTVMPTVCSRPTRFLAFPPTRFSSAAHRNPAMARNPPGFRRKIRYSTADHQTVLPTAASALRPKPSLRMG